MIGLNQAIKEVMQVDVIQPPLVYRLLKFGFSEGSQEPIKKTDLTADLIRFSVSLSCYKISLEIIYNVSDACELMAFNLVHSFIF